MGRKSCCLLIEKLEELERLLGEPVRRFREPEPEPVDLRPLISHIHNQLF